MKMRLLVLRLFLVLPAFKSEAQNTIAEIDALSKQVQSQLEEFEKKTEKDEKGSRDLYYSGDQLQLMQVAEDGDPMKIVSWYFYKGRLMLTETTWTKKETGKLLYYCKTYHRGGRMIACIREDGQFDDASTAEFRRTEKEIQAYADKLLELYNH